MFNRFLLLIAIFCFISCNTNNKENMATLGADDKTLSFIIPSDVKTPQSGVFTFTCNCKNYLSFQNFPKSEILIYELETGQFVKKVNIMAEGENAVAGGFGGYYITDMEHIFIPSLYLPVIFEVDTTGIVKQRIRYDKTQDSQPLIPFVPNSKLQMTFIGNDLYIPQGLNKMLNEEVLSKSPTKAVIDTISKTVAVLPMKIPSLITLKDLGTSASFGCEYSDCFDGRNFIYSFFYDEHLYITSPKHERVEKIIAKSRYIKNIEVFRSNEPNFRKMTQKQCEHASYGAIVYDKFRDVYYRFTYPPTNLDDYEGNFVELIRSGKKQFSIIILNNKLEIIGETLFPEYTYNSNLFFILKDGLYISTSHINNNNYSDDVLSFQKIKLKY